ncbi:diguanylate cyclase [Chromatiaceae bacterium AAb-1]|nr:diguanylate cyclase [Chromatiaceae bacterium AAb-1]
MPKLDNERLAQEWAQLLARFKEDVLQQSREITSGHKQILAESFYRHMLQDSAAAVYLSHDLVKTRLSSSMQNWLTSLFSYVSADDIQVAIAQQIKIGEVHARIGIPVHLVLRGARHLKEQLYFLLQQQNVLQPQIALELIDLAMEIMSQAYSRSYERYSRTEEAYRLFSVAQNIAYERDKQRAALLDWENHLMFDCAVGLKASQLPRISASEFGLWFRHKGAHAFEGATESGIILQAMQHIDEALIPLFDLTAGQTPETSLQRLRDLREQAKGIRYHLDTLFEQHSELEAGRDILTRLLNRRFLPAVLAKEVGFARQHQTLFAILAIDIDHFKQINDGYGHEAGDMVLQQVASLLNNNSRGGDYLFRLGGEEFLMLLVDITPQDAFKVAEKIRKQVESEVFLLPREQTRHLTLSIGLAMHNGHPDYQQALRSADEALYQAKHSGRNRVVAAATAV